MITIGFIDKTPPGEFQVMSPLLKNPLMRKKGYNYKKSPYKLIPKYLPTVESTELYYSQLQSPIGFDPLEDFSFALTPQQSF